MPTRIALAGFVHETNTFAATPTTLADFVANGLHLEDELRSFGGTNTVIGGSVSAAETDLDIELIPIVATSAIPGGPVAADTFEDIVGRIVRGIAVGVHLMKSAKHHDAAWDFANFYGSRPLPPSGAPSAPPPRCWST